MKKPPNQNIQNQKNLLHSDEFRQSVCFTYRLDKFSPLLYNIQYRKMQI